jgi:3alpha(or 20beta)-hydroxysteroid dehydrogenase
MGRLAGKVVLISGAGRGIGAAEAELFVNEGAKIVLGDISEQVHEIAATLGATARSIILDVTSAQSWKAAIDLTVQSFGGLDVLVNNAGIFRPGTIADMDGDAFMELVKVNQLGTFLGMQAAARVMRQGGSIINTSSVAGLFGTPGGSAYCASKWAVRGLTRSAAMELGPQGIRVNSLHPGGVDTPMLAGQQPEGTSYDAVFANYPIPRVGKPEELARAALFLASEESAYMTGAEMVVDGGLNAGPMLGPIRD